MDERLIKHSLGFWEVRDKPSAEELQAYYAEKYYQTERSSYRTTYTDDERQYLQVKLRQRHHVVKSILGDTSGRLLDVGCGEGFTLAYFRKQGWTIEGIDFSDAGLLAMNPDCADVLEIGDLYALLDKRMQGRNTYDLIWLQNVLEHVLDPVDLLRRLRLLVALGGVLVVTVPNDGSALQEALFKRGDIASRFWIAIPDHVSYFTSDSLKATAESTGWEVREMIADFPVDWFLTHSGANYVSDRNLGPSAHASRLLIENLIGEQPDGSAVAFYSAMAALALGRNVTAFMKPGARE